MWTQIKSAPARCARAFIRARDGLAATEFALIAPVMLILFLGIVEASSALSASRRTAIAANTLADLVAQETEITKAQLDDIYIGVEDIISNQAIAVTFKVVSLVVDPDTNKVVVHWSIDNKGVTPYAAGTEYPKMKNVALIDSGSSIIITETDYQYKSGLTHKFFKDMTFSKRATRWPRRSPKVQYCVTAGNCTS